MSKHKPFGGINIDRHAPGCDDQLPLVSRVGRGLQGNSFRVKITDPDSTTQTYLEGWEYDHDTKTESLVWTSENINGGHLSYHQNLRPFTIPQTFTMTWIYDRPGRPEWSETTPAIPYLWDADEDGKPDVDGIVGSGIANLFVREGVNAEWNQVHRHGKDIPVPPQLPSSDGRWGQLNWPIGTEPKNFNGAAPDEKWAATITFGFGGDVEVPNLDDIAKIIGVTREVIENILREVPGALDGSDNVKDYIDDLRKHLHDDMGFGDSLIGDTPGATIPAIDPATWTRPGAGKPYTIKNYIDYMIGRSLDYTDAEIAKVNAKITNIDASITKINKTLADIVTKIYGGGTVNPDGSITWPNNHKIAVGNINVTSGGETSGNGIYTRTPNTNNDLDFQ